MPQWPETGKIIMLTRKVEDFTEVKSDSPFHLDNISIEDAIEGFASHIYKHTN